MTEEKGKALEVEQKQEMGTVGNLCAADQANASVNRKRGLEPYVSPRVCMCMSLFPVINVKTDVLTITKSLLTFHLNPKVNIFLLKAMTLQSAIPTDRTRQNYTAELPNTQTIALKP